MNAYPDRFLLGSDTWTSEQAECACGKMKLRELNCARGCFCESIEKSGYASPPAPLGPRSFR